MWFVDYFMGFVPESIWTTDIVPLATYYPNLHVFLETYILMAVAASSTERIPIGSSVTNAICRHSALIDQSFLTLTTSSVIESF